MKALRIQKSENIVIMKLRFLLLHVACLGVFFVPFSQSLLILTIIMFFAKTFGLEAGYHRYFAHKSFKTGRIFQFILALLGASGGYRGPLWWAAYHRYHHRYADTKNDIHSPSHTSFWYAHMGWFFNPSILETDLTKVKEFLKFPELILLNRLHYLCAFIQIGLLYCLGSFTHIMGPHVTGLQCVIYGFFLSTVLGLHTTFAINSIAHQKGFGGYRRFNTDDMTRNNGWLAIPSMGGSWHNNHHRYAATARAGFYYWEIDLTYYILRILALVGIVWDIRAVPPDILEEGRTIKGK
jgi:stearoyl-CoA desaturase (Delta-9 desaturase)